MKFTARPSVEMIQSMGSDESIARAAMVSTKGQMSCEPVAQEKQKGLIGYLIKHRHGTPFEHSAVTFFVRAPIFVWREWHRHRVGFSYNEESARYKQLEPEFWIPGPTRPMVPVGTSARPKFETASEDQYLALRAGLESGYQHAYATYESLMEKGISKEVARAVLPVGIFSSCWVTCNPRSLMHFLSLRVYDERPSL